MMRQRPTDVNTISKPTRDEISQKNLETALFGFAILLRALVGFHSHSGQDNYEGSRVAYGGDFEAQRHWMELTWQLPIGQWYWYDLEYWGLDYPPLTAYVSYVCGFFSHVLVGPHSVALVSSRGLEDPVHKAFMRVTVLILDVLVYGLAIWYATDRSTEGRRHSSLWIYTLAMAQPAILLIDHGHFQYNTVALGLSIAGFSYMVQPEFRNCIVGSILFCLALNFKQMTLYYAPPVFCYLLGRCLSQPRLLVGRFLSLAMTVLITFGILWAPFLVYGPSNTTPMDRLLHVLGRIFPFQRGLFEGKVANLWCVLSTKPIRIRNRIPSELQPILALALTFLLILPACYRMLRLGLQPFPTTPTTTTSTTTTTGDHRHWTLFLWATMASALSFFLASFQVHEKSILLALAPCSLLLWHDPMLVDWFSIVCCWSLWPLLQTDRLQVPYMCCLGIFEAMIRLRKSTTGQASSLVPSWMPSASYGAMLGLHVAQLILPVPANLPDLFEVLWAMVGCGMFCMAWCMTGIKLFGGPLNPEFQKAKVS